MPRIDYIITARDETRKALQSAERGMKAFEKKHQETIKQLKEVALPSAAFFAAFVLGAKKAVEESNKTESALAGLSSVAAAFIGDAEGAKQAAVDLAEDGLLTLAEAAAGVKNLLARGFSLPEATQLMNNFKDSAAFGRQGALGFGEAIVGATEGLKNQMSQMVDNAGVTKNLSNIHKDYATSIGTTIGKLTEAQKREAELQGIRQETAAQLGDAAKLTELFGGKQAKLLATSNKLASALGDKIKPALSEVLEIINNGANTVLTFVESHETATKVILALAGALAGGAGLVAAAGALVTILPALTAGIGLLGTAFTFATGPVGLIAMGVAAAVVLFLKFRHQLADLVEFIVRVVSGKLADMAENLAKVISVAEGLPGIGKKAKELAAKLVDVAAKARKFGEDFEIGGGKAEEAIEKVAETTDESVDDVKDSLAEGAAAMADFASKVEDDIARINSAQVESADLHEQMTERRRAAAFAEAEYRGRLVQQEIDNQRRVQGKIIAAQGEWQSSMEGSFKNIEGRHGEMWDGVEKRSGSAFDGLQNNFGDSKASIWMQMILQIAKVMDAAIELFENLERRGMPDISGAGYQYDVSNPSPTGGYRVTGGYAGKAAAESSPGVMATGQVAFHQHFYGSTLVDRAQGLDTVQTLRDLEGEYDRGLTFAGAS